MINTTFINNLLARADKCHNVDPSDDELGGVVYISGYEADILIQNSTFKSNQSTDQSHFIVLHENRSPRIANSFFSYVEKDHPSFISHIGLQQSTPLTIRFWNNTFISGKIARKSAGKGFTKRAKRNKRIVSSEVSPVQFTETPYASRGYFFTVHKQSLRRLCFLRSVCPQGGACVVGGHAWQGGMHDGEGACVPGGMCGGFINDRECMAGGLVL